MLPPQRRSSSRHDNGSRPQTLPRHSHAGSNRIPGSLPERLPGDVPGKVPLGVPPDQLSQWTGILEKVSEVKLLPMLNIILKHLLLSAIGFPYYNIFCHIFSKVFCRRCSFLCYLILISKYSHPLSKKVIFVIHFDM